MIQYLVWNQALTWIRLAHHRWNENVIDDTTLIFLYPRIYLSIDKSGLRSINLARNRWNENVIDKLYLIFKSRYLKYFISLKSERKFELSISNEMWQHIFRYPVGSYIFTFLTYVPGLYFVSSRMWQLSNYLEEGEVYFQITIPQIFQISRIRT